MRLLIVDDEVIIRNGLSTVINWEELGFTLLQPAASAEEALERIPIEQPHIILTDIRMNGKSGLELAGEVKRTHPETEIVVLSGYDEFTYTQQAIREGVSDYLLKTSRPEDIIKAAIRAKQRLMNKWEGRKQDQVKQAAYRNGLLERLLTGETHDAEILQGLRRLSPHLQLEAFDRQSLQVVLLSADGWGDSVHFTNLLNFAVDNMLTELLECESMIWKRNLLLIVKHASPYGEDGRIKSEIVRTERKLKCKIFTATGPCVKKLEDLNTSFAKALHAFSYGWLMGGEGYVDYDQVKDRKGIRTVCSQEEESELVTILINGNLIELSEWIAALLARLSKEPEVTPGSMIAYLHSVVIAGHRWLERVASSVGLSIPFQDRKMLDTDELASLPEDTLFEHCETIIEMYQKMTSGKVSYVQNAIVYIREHLDQNLSLHQVARHVHVNPNYFSEMFKRGTGQNYIEFVTNERMEKAMSILNETPAKISEVTKRVGYEDIKYFSRLFKKYTGCTPSEFRNKS